jgi:hypothetical protein
MPTFTIKGNDFALTVEPFRILSGALWTHGAGLHIRSPQPLYQIPIQLVDVNGHRQVLWT